MCLIVQRLCFPTALDYAHSSKSSMISETSKCFMKRCTQRSAPLTRMSLSHRLRGKHEGAIMSREVVVPIHRTIHCFFVCFFFCGAGRINRLINVMSWSHSAQSSQASLHYIRQRQHTHTHEREGAMWISGSDHSEAWEGRGREWVLFSPLWCFFFFFNSSHAECSQFGLVKLRSV